MLVDIGYVMVLVGSIISVAGTLLMAIGGIF